MPAKPSLRPLLPVLVGVGLSTGLQAAVTIEPATVPAGKTSEVTLRFDHPEAGRSVSLQPGGPWLVERIPLDGSHPAYQILRRHNGLYLRDAANRVIAFFANQRGHASSANYDFVAADAAGLQIYKEHDWRHTRPVAGYRTSTPALDVAVSETLAFVAGGRGGLTVLDVENPERPLWLGSHQKLGRATKVSAEGRRAAVLNDAGNIFLLDADNPAEPTTFSAWRSHTPLLDIALHGNHVFALTPAAILVVDFSAETPQLSNEGLDFGQGVNLGGERRVFIANDLAYVADWFSGIHIYDLSRPRQPELLASFHTPGSPKGIVVRDGVAFVADDDHGLQIIDVSDPLHPQQVSTLLTNGLAYTPRLAGDLLFLASHRGGFQIIDVSDVTQPKLVSEYDTEGKAWSMEVHGDIAYVADDDSGLLIFDVSDPARPALIGRYFTGAAAEEVTVRGDIAFVAFFNDGLHIVDVSEPRQPQPVGQLALPGNARGLDLVGDTLYVAGWLAGVHIVDVSDVRQPKLLGSHDTRGGAWGVEVVDEHLYAMDWWGGVSVINVADPTRPRAVGGYHNRGHVYDIAARDNYGFVAHGSNGLQVFDIKNPLNPTWTTGVSLPGQARQVALHGKRAYVAAGDGGLAVVDISNPFNLRWVDSYDTRGEVGAVAADGQHAYLIDSREGLVALDIRHDSPRKLASLDIHPHDLWLDDGLLYLATGRGVEVVRLNQQGEFEPVTVFELAAGARHLHGDDRLLYAASGGTVISLKRKPQLEEVGRIEVGSNITGLARGDQDLLISTDATLISITSHYPLLSHASNITYHRGVVYISGAETITALRPLPPLEQQTRGLAEIQFVLPETLGVGSYDLKISDKNGSTTVIHNAIRVVMSEFSKPSMSMEEFKKLLQQQQNNSDLFTAPPDQQ